MADHGERFTEAEFKRLKPKIEAIYKEAYRDIVKKSEAWAEKHEKRALRYQQMVKDGRLSKADYDAWMRGQVFQGNQWKARKQQIADTLYHADRAALDIVNRSRYRVFSENANTMGYGLECGAASKSSILPSAVSPEAKPPLPGAKVPYGRIDTGFTLYDSNSVARLARDNPDLLPPKKTVGKDASYRWYNRQIGTAITQGIIQGETVKEIAKRIGRKTGEGNCAATLRNARTMYTGVQNAGRLEGMRQAQRLGIRVQKRWIAILDSKTRDSHQVLDGQIQEVEDPFESPLGLIMYPGDEGADDPADVWNCRCSMIYEHPEYPSEMIRRDAETGEIVEDMTYKEWVRMKAARGEAAGAEKPAGGSGKAQTDAKSGLTGSGEAGTIGTGVERKLVYDGIETESMPQEQLNKIVSAFRRNGGVIEMGPEADKFLQWRGVEAITYNADTIILSMAPSRAAVFEELIHTHQWRSGELVDEPISRAKAEIAAKEKLLRCARVYHLTNGDVEITKLLLEKDRADLELLLGGDTK